MLGQDNFKVQVAADIDFSQSEQTAETYRPNNARKVPVSVVGKTMKAPVSIKPLAAYQVR
jgi:flagellar biosynthesis/type III secretory pathway M-ring protein FliF/YscJ